MSDQFTPQEQFLAERLRRAPQPQLNTATFEAIRLRLLDALDNPPPAPLPQPGLPLSTVILVALVIIAAVTAIIVVVVSRQTPLPITAITPVVTVSPSAMPSATTTLSATPAPTTTFTPTPSPVATIENITVIEGTVESIDGNIITIFGVEVQIDTSNPLLKTIQIGDVIRVEGNTQTTTNGITVIATTVTYVNVDVNVAPPSGEVWQDDGTCLNPPPDWAPAHGWRRRCQDGVGNSGNNGGGMGDDDDD